MPSWGEMAQMIVALTSLGSLLMSVHNARKIKIVHDATNSMKDELVAEVRKGSLAEGLAAGREEGKRERD
jgi:hypothetical protein